MMHTDNTLRMASGSSPPYSIRQEPIYIDLSVCCETTFKKAQAGNMKIVINCDIMQMN